MYDFDFSTQHYYLLLLHFISYHYHYTLFLIIIITLTFVGVEVIEETGSDIKGSIAERTAEDAIKIWFLGECFFVFINILFFVLFLRNILQLRFDIGIINGGKIVDFQYIFRKKLGTSPDLRGFREKFWFDVNASVHAGFDVNTKARLDVFISMVF